MSDDCNPHGLDRPLAATRPSNRLNHCRNYPPGTPWHPVGAADGLSWGYDIESPDLRLTEHRRAR